jgi:hypothetical protein
LVITLPKGPFYKRVNFLACAIAGFLLSQKVFRLGYILFSRLQSKLKEIFLKTAKLTREGIKNRIRRIFGRRSR